LLMTGVLGEYVGRIYEEIKRRPLYVTQEEVNLGPGASERQPYALKEEVNLSSGVSERQSAD
jgi:hypothetical protein